MTARDNEALYALCLFLVVDAVADLHHAAPALADDMACVESEVLSESEELFHPYFLVPEFRMSVEIRVAASDLVIHNDHSLVVVSYVVENLIVVMCRSRSAVEADKRRLTVVLILLAYDSVISLISHERHIAFCDLSHFSFLSD